MAYCAKCGTLMEGEYCSNCGTPAGVAPAERPFLQPASTQPGATRPGAEPGVRGLGVNGASALCYLFGFVTGIVFLLLAPYNRERLVRFHAFQSIFLSVAVAVLDAGISIVSQMLLAVSVSLGALMGLLHAVVNLGSFALVVYMMWKSYQGEMVVLPVIGELAERQVGGKGPDSPAGTMGRAA